MQYRRPGCPCSGLRTLAPYQPKAHLPRSSHHFLARRRGRGPAVGTVAAPLEMAQGRGLDGLRGLTVTPPQHAKSRAAGRCLPRETKAAPVQLLMQFFLLSAATINSTRPKVAGLLRFRVWILMFAGRGLERGR